jgi:hypothetical protein
MTLNEKLQGDYDLCEMTDLVCSGLEVFYFNLITWVGYG